MKRIALALCLAAVTATAVAQTADERGFAAEQQEAFVADSRRPRRRSPAVLKWLHDHSQPPKPTRTTRTTDKPKAEAKVEPKPEPEAETKKPKASPEPSTAKAAEQPKPDVAKSETKTEAKAEPKIATRPEVQDGVWRRWRRHMAHRHQQKPVDDAGGPRW